MTERAGPWYRELYDRIAFFEGNPVDFTSTDPEVTPDKVTRLIYEAAYLNTEAVSIFGGRLGPEREPGLLAQVIGAAFQTFGDHDPHPEPFDKAAMLLRGITQGHPFSDGNKRTGFLTAGYYLEQMGFPIPPELPEDDVVNFCLEVSAGEIRDVGEMTDSLRRFWGLPPA